MSKTDKNIKAIGGYFVLVWLVMWFCAIWIAEYRFEFTMGGIYALCLAFVCVFSIKNDVKKEE